MISRVLFYAPVAKGRIYKTYVYGIELLILMSSKKSKLQNLMNLSVTWSNLHKNEIKDFFSKCSVSCEFGHIYWRNS